MSEKNVSTPPHRWIQMHGYKICDRCKLEVKSIGFDGKGEMFRYIRDVGYKIVGESFPLPKCKKL